MQDVRQNCEALRHCFNILNAVMREYEGRKVSGAEHCDAFTLSAAARIIYTRWEVEKRKLGNTPPPSTDFHPPAPLPLPSLPDYLSSIIHHDIKNSAFYQAVWGNASKK